MREVFVDTAFWVAILSPVDRHHDLAKAWAEQCKGHRLVTTNMVLTEVAAFFSAHGSELRAAVTQLIVQIEEDSNIDLLYDDQEMNQRARRLYANRPDKQYSLVDCYSMEVMKYRNMSVALTTDQHFEQEGLVALLRQDVARASDLLG